MFFAHFDGLLETGPWLFSLGLMLLALPLLIAVGAAAVSFFSVWSGRASGKVFAEKLAKQLAEFGVIVLGLWLLLILARWGMWVASWWPASSLSQVFYALFFDVPGQLALVATLATLALVRLWKRSRLASGAHLSLGAASMILWLTTLLLFVAGTLWRLDGVFPETKLSQEGFMAIAVDPMPWLVWGQSMFLAVALGAGFALLYLLARRNREDYGRDYYGWVVQRCAWWAIIAGVVQAGWAKAVFWHGVLAGVDRTMLAGVDWVRETITAMLGHPALPALVLALCLAFLSWLCLVPVLKTRTPLRMKGWMLLHALLAVFSLTSLCRMYAELLG